MSTHHLTLLTIVAEEALAQSISSEIMSLGARGYTLSAVSGQGLSGVRDNQWEGENVKIETIVSEVRCQTILEHLDRKYFERYAIIAFYHPVNVVRTQHFV